MAFRQPIVAPRRPDPLHGPQYNNSPTVPVSAQRTVHDESREWVLFPPSQAHSTSQTRTTCTAHTPQTAGRSRISDFGSIGITVRSDGNERDLAREGDDGARDEEEELDSLDEGLHAFHDPTVDRYTRFLGRSGTILPTHDGLGMFPPSSLQVQEHLWQFEQHNPRKRMADTQLSSSSLRRHLDITADAEDAKMDSERRQRIEDWRIDQARLLLDEIEKQSRKMRRSQSNGQRGSCASPGSGARGVESSVGDSMHQHVGGVEGGGGGDNQEESGPKETLLEGITRRLCDLLGIDDFLLSIIFGDALPADENPSKLTSSSLPELDPPSNQPTVSSLVPEGHDRLLSRLTRELGFVIEQHLSENPGAFSSYLHASSPEISPPCGPSSSLNQRKPEKSLPLHDLAKSSSSSAASPSPQFRPTLKNVQRDIPSTSRSETANAALWSIEDEERNHHFRLPSIAEERAYWERTPDVKSIFRLLHTRFTAGDHGHEQQQPQSPNLQPNLDKNMATAPPTTSTALLASLHCASVISQHHPLVSVSISKGNGLGPARRTTRPSLFNNHHNHHHHHHHHHPHQQQQQQRQHTNRQIFSSLLRRTGNSTNSCSYSNSCASSSLLRKSKRASGSSRDYWDLDLGWSG